MIQGVLGYDWFVSYSQRVPRNATGDPGARFAHALAEQLAKTHRVCIDIKEYKAGERLSVITLLRVRRSKYLLLVLTPASTESEWVQQEVEVALRTGREIIVVGVDGQWEKLSANHPFRVHLQDRLRESVTSEQGHPAPGSAGALARRRTISGVSDP